MAKNTSLPSYGTGECHRLDFDTGCVRNCSAIERDTFVTVLERAEKRVVACSFLLAKIISVVALLLSLIVLEAGAVSRIWHTEFRSDGFATRNGLTFALTRPTP